MKKNKITEFDGHGTFTDANTIEVSLSDGSTDDGDVRQRHHRHRQRHQAAAGRRGVATTSSPTRSRSSTRDLPESIVIVGAGAIGMEFAYVHANYGVKVTIVEFLDRVLPNEDEDVSSEIAKQYKKLGRHVLTSTRVDSVKDLGAEGVVVTGERQGRQERGDPRRQGADVDRVRPPRRGLRPREHRRAAHRARRDRDRRADAHVGAAHLRDRRRHRQAAARARRRGAGRRGGRDHRRRRDDGARRLPDDAACHLLPAAGRQLRPHRAAGPRRGLRHQGRQVPVHRQRQGARPRRRQPASSS